MNPFIDVVAFSDIGGGDYRASLTINDPRTGKMMLHNVFSVFGAAITANLTLELVRNGLTISLDTSSLSAATQDQFLPTYVVPIVAGDTIRVTVDAAPHANSRVMFVCSER